MSNSKKIVLDANIVVRAVLGKKVRDLIQEFSPTTQFFTPDLCLDDAVKYLPILFQKRNLPPDEALAVLAGLIHLIEIVDAAVYSGYEVEAKQRIAARDVNDWPIVAAALLLDCPIWTEDNDFFGCGVAIWTIDRIRLFLAA
ncbi:PIN domain-containing protein [Chamaesiphon sp. OTE_8_metabat_110]|uniref:PIN domain-containing protein n=1 Tax=Chamaesiphon sp. OTE_8_metabat_110 TaxID=2964696 RepID=UPI002869FEFE|nr:PIN domain-containing protein [Chamaesiphon sp. OTE_8_metabat_110]